MQRDLIRFCRDITALTLFYYGYHHNLFPLQKPKAKRFHEEHAKRFETWLSEAIVEAEEDTSNMQGRRLGHTRAKSLLFWDGL